MSDIDEAEVVAAARAGLVVGPEAAGERAVVQAATLRRCCHELAGQVDPRGLRLKNVVVAGRLDLAGLTVPFPLRFEGCEFESVLVVEGAELFELTLTRCQRLPGLLGNGLRLRRDLDLSGSRVMGAHWTSASTLRANNGNGTVYTTAGALAAPAGAPAGSGSTRADVCGDGQVRCFSPVLYAIDTVIPLISLDQRTTWYADPHAPWGEVMMWWLNLATMLGWLLSSIFVLSLTRLARSP